MEAYQTPLGGTASKPRTRIPLSWSLEIISCILALAALAATIATVAVYNGRTLPNWPHPITINSMISIFTAIFKASLIMPIAEGISQLKWYWFNEPRPLIDLDRFDIASRGPWGSLLLLFHARKHYLASLGAFITIAALAVDPFSQQVLQYYDCLQTVPGTIARIPKTNRYSVGGMHTGAGSATLDGPTQVGIYMGLLNPPSNSSVSISVDCSTGNCTFPADSGATFSTLSMCHSCTDISDTVSVNNTVPKNYTLESGAWIGREVLASTVRANYTDEVFAFEALMLNYPDTCNAATEQASSGCMPQNPFAVRCSLKPCLQTYGANVTESVYSETLVSSENLPYVVENGYYWILATNRTLDNGVWRDCNGTSSPTSSNDVGVGPNGTLWGTEDRTEANIYYPDSCIWVFNYTSALPLREFLDGMIHGDKLQYYASPTAIIGDLWLQNLYRNGTANTSTADAFMDGLTISMTANIRTRGETPSTGYATGTPLASKTCIRVRWAWFALPIALWLLTVGFLTFLLLKSAFQADSRLWWQKGTWKSSILVPLFHGFDSNTQEKLHSPIEAATDASAPAVSGQEMQGIARNMRVQLCSGDSGLKFVQASAGEADVKTIDQAGFTSDENSAQRGSLLVPDPDVGMASHTSRPQSRMSRRSISPPL